MRRITQQWHLNDENLDVTETLDDLKESLNELRQVLLEDEEGRRESGPDEEEEADVLRSLETHNAGVDEDRTIPEAEGEGDMSSDEEMADEEDEEDMSDDEEASDEEEMGDNERMDEGENMGGKDESGDEKDDVKLNDLALIGQNR